MIIYLLKRVVASFKLVFARYFLLKLGGKFKDGREITEADRQRWTLLQGIILSKGKQQWRWYKFFWKPRLLSTCCLLPVKNGICPKCKKKNKGVMK